MAAMVIGRRPGHSSANDRLFRRTMMLDPEPAGAAGTPKQTERPLIANIVDRRREKSRWRRIWGVVEPTAADCCGNGAPWDAAVACDGFRPAPMPEVLAWAADYTGHVTLHLYDHEPFEGADAEEGGDTQEQVGEEAQARGRR
jgi:hypothetical protein